ncbi:hypothetical protein [Thiobacillus sp. 0-1251]|uniref:hypothetical protein n=1 Tax=Thiobacillus sp. 0-1251 TaxID=1895858 RepID=UPI000961230C|nr:hypothetical protein [Thiobacillus sp. 0-1251]OJY58970.1 MAG: hypothetical protein BGP19_08290 [Thiobacillus sp. 0-1251]
MQIGKEASILALGAAVAACLAAPIAASAGEPASSERTILAGGMGMMGGMGMHRDMMQGMMGGALPPGIDPARLPEPDSSGAHLLGQFCMQCHNLPGPGLHTAPEWPQVLGRMNMRMRMMGGMMGGMMGVAAPDPVQLEILLGYLQRHAQKPIDAAAYPDLDTPPGRAFGTTCMQCHALPDPKQHTAQEWPSVVARMRDHMTAMGKILPDETTTNEIVDFLQRHSTAQK